MPVANYQVDLWRATTTNANGRVSKVYQRYAKGIPCYLEEKSGVESMVAGQDRPVRAGEAYFTRSMVGGQTILNDDQIRWESRTLRIQAVDDIQANPAFSDMVRVQWREADNAER
jgi:hypothetical protein